jgi:hypothetical protein
MPSTPSEFPGAGGVIDPASRLGQIEGPLQHGDTCDQSTRMNENDRVVRACLQTAVTHRGRGVEPFSLARRLKRWTRSRWDAAYAEYRLKMAGRLEEATLD